MASSLKRRSGTGISGAVSTLMGAHKNPAKHATRRLLEVLESEELADLPEVIAHAGEALDMLTADNAPANTRNPFYALVLSTFIDVGKDRIAHARGRLNGQEAVARERLFDFTQRACMRAFTSLPMEMAKKADVARIGELLFSVVVKTKGFYRGVAAPAKRAMTEAHAAEAKAAAAARIAALETRFAALRVTGGRRLTLRAASWRTASWRTASRRRGLTRRG